MVQIKSKNKECRIELDKERLRAILDASPDPIVILDLEGIIVDCNEAAPKTLGLSKDDLVNKSADIISKEEDRGKMADVIQDIIKSGEVRRGEYIILGKNGKEIISDASMNLVKDVNGHPTNIAVVVRDITERKKDEEYIHLLSCVAEQAPEGIVVFDLQGKVLFANSAWCELRGIGDKSELNKEHIERVYEDLNVQGLFGTDEVFRCRLTMKKKDGSKFQVLATIRLLERENGKMIGGIHVVKKLSEIAREIRDVSSTGFYQTASKETEA